MRQFVLGFSTFLTRPGPGQQEGRQKRRKAEYELTQMEQELRENLLVLSQKEKRVKEEMRGQ